MLQLVMLTVSNPSHLNAKVFFFSETMTIRIPNYKPNAIKITQLNRLTSLCSHNEGLFFGTHVNPPWLQKSESTLYFYNSNYLK